MQWLTSLGYLSCVGKKYGKKSVGKIDEDIIYKRRLPHRSNLFFMYFFEIDSPISRLVDFDLHAVVAKELTRG